MEGYVLEMKKMDEKSQPLSENLVGLEHDKVALSVVVVQLKHENEGLSIQLESDEKDLVDKDQSVPKMSSLVDGLEADLGCMMKDGLFTVVDRVLEIKEFAYDVNQFCDAFMEVRKA